MVQKIGQLNANELPKEEFKREVERHLAGQETEPWELIYFKLYKSQGKTYDFFRTFEEE